jgi:soluble lytic murein transglycosylase-like protein
MLVRIVALLMFCQITVIGGLLTETSAEVYVRTHPDGHKEFTNRPSGSGWIFCMSESGGEPVIEFAKEGKPRGLDEIVSEIADKFNIDANLVKAIIVAESNSNPNAVSKKGAQGLMQLMPSTARDMKVSSPFDPRENIIGGVKYIKGLLASYGDLRLALAAYNAGPGNVQKYAGIPPYRETINYVKRVIAQYQRFKKDPTLRVEGS